MKLRPDRIVRHSRYNKSSTACAVSADSRQVRAPESKINPSRCRLTFTHKASRDMSRQPPRFRVRTAIRAAGLVVAAIAVACSSAWGAGLLYFAGPYGEHTRAVLAIIFLAGSIGVIAMLFTPGWRR